MSFDFSKFVKPIDGDLEKKSDVRSVEKLQCNKEVLVDNTFLEGNIKKNENHLSKEETSYEKVSKMSFDDMIDYLVDKYKNSPKILLNTALILCEYNDKTHDMKITNKNKNKTILVSNSRELFEDIAFKTAKRIDKQNKLLIEFESRFKEVIDNESIEQSL